jgi:hypothetical protein
LIGVVALGDGVGLAVAVGLGMGLAVAVAVGLGVWVAVGSEVLVVVAVGRGDGVAEGGGLVVEGGRDVGVITEATGSAAQPANSPALVVKNVRKK